jgi:hypothetical protein
MQFGPAGQLLQAKSPAKPKQIIYLDDSAGGANVSKLKVICASWIDVHRWQISVCQE